MPTAGHIVCQYAAVHTCASSCSSAATLPYHFRSHKEMHTVSRFLPKPGEADTMLSTNLKFSKGGSFSTNHSLLLQGHCAPHLQLAAQSSGSSHAHDHLRTLPTNSTGATGRSWQCACPIDCSLTLTASRLTEDSPLHLTYRRYTNHQPLKLTVSLDTTHAA